MLVALDPVAAALAADMAAKAETAGNPTSAAAAVEAATEPMATAVAAGITPSPYRGGDGGTAAGGGGGGSPSSDSGTGGKGGDGIAVITYNIMEA